MADVEAGRPNGPQSPRLAPGLLSGSQSRPDAAVHVPTHSQPDASARLKPPSGPRCRSSSASTCGRRCFVASSRPRAGRADLWLCRLLRDAAGICPPGATHGPAQCPVLLRPGFRVREQVAGDAGPRPRLRRPAGPLRLGRRSLEDISNVGHVAASRSSSRSASPTCPSCSPIRSAGRGRCSRPTRDGVPRQLRGAVGPDVHASGPMPCRSSSGSTWPPGCSATSASSKTSPGSWRSAATPRRWSTIPTGPATTAAPAAAIRASPMPAWRRRCSTTRRCGRGLADRGIEIPADTLVRAGGACHHDRRGPVPRHRQPAGQSCRGALPTCERWMAAAGAATRLERSRRLGAEVTPLPKATAAAVAAEAATQAGRRAAAQPRLVGGAAGVGAGGQRRLHRRAPVADGRPRPRRPHVHARLRPLPRSRRQGARADHDGADDRDELDQPPVLRLGGRQPGLRQRQQADPQRDGPVRRVCSATAAT